MRTSTLPIHMRGAPGIIRLHGHRGARGVLPENTLIGYRNTFEIGVQVVEIDIMVTADGIPVLTHNPSLMAAATRGPDGNWLEQDSKPIVQMSHHELQQFDVGGLRDGTSYAARYPDQAFLNDLKIPDLAQLVDMALEPEFADIWLNIEIKSNPDRPGDAPPLPQLVAPVLAVINDAALADRVLLQSFDWRVLAEIARQAPDIPRSHLTFATRNHPTMAANVTEGSLWMDGASLAMHNGSVPQVVSSLGGAVWSPYFQDLTADALAEARALGLVVNVWTVNERADIDRMIDLGVDGIITDYPARAQRRLLAKGVSWREDITPSPSCY
jgi:glycerophosphoryl diester phosphodiesterase